MNAAWTVRTAALGSYQLPETHLQLANRLQLHTTLLALKDVEGVGVGPEAVVGKKTLRTLTNGTLKMPQPRRESPQNSRTC